MNRIDRAFAELRARGGRAFIPFLTGGYPDRESFLAVAAAAARGGAAVLEIGIPFSDPVADGPVIQASSEAALAGGATLVTLLDDIARLRALIETPMVLMGYANPIESMGYARFVEEALRCGADGVIVPDLPPEEADELIAAARARDFATIFLAATTSSDARVRAVTRASTGYVYFVTRLGVTGADAAPEDIGAMVARLRRHTDLPIAAGFGIATPEQAARVCETADAAIVGSALVRLVTEHKDAPDLAERVEAFCRAMTDACAG
ncbi:tryptophan synthase subunit alpha [bacterium]|nr:tryptophan synthase subunit alpha [bacterium]